MTATDRPTPRAARPRAMRDDLLQDLRLAAPVPVAPPAAECSPAAGRTPAAGRAPAADKTPAAARTTERPVERPRPLEVRAPGVELRLTLQRWSTPRVQAATGAWGVVLSAGPLRFSLTFSGR
ncbi:MAG TPA: hypothetical protein VHF92_19160 [Geodermatophilus sp.]|nr:hypothetical protein [Geodermatophilus sp.]